MHHSWSLLCRGRKKTSSTLMWWSQLHHSRRTSNGHLRSGAHICSLLEEQRGSCSMNYECIRHNVSCYLSQTIEFNGISCNLSSTKHPTIAASKTGSFHIPHIQNSQYQFNQQKLYLWNLKFIHQGMHYGHQKENSVLWILDFLFNHPRLNAKSS